MKKGIVIWLTGLPCSGKTTLSKEIEKYFQQKNLPIQRLDGDVVRETISKDLGFSKKDRDINIERLSYVAQMLSDNGVNVVSAFVSPYQKMRDFTRSLCENFVEVYVKCDIEECKKRDVKGMYAKAAKGQIKDFTGVDDPYENPKNPEIVVSTEKENIKESVEKIINYLEKNNG
ncbi:MAG: Adenylyl-sulfate kinase [Candidatus Moranbacteria bacterium GW2011_GWE2_35_2-]|nr:MAG: Adenylyl-sulfate kinase [Candidatus Moranbacteria bacterium GW2011_GWE2_35_2-]KKQ06812.1 MAG: Adenylyl-sulfate kinase [Candidatus Moranbacteria bacterium GW2011_GWF1_36_4]KKQ22874.1 MAG: Adenylyl-sulfate kinase [Candidatus Moranbacteria bacterium GW2011_GWF2_37_11]KKQ29232.1 MAG: Adenylyl-sulfate kinase [Candidatus Moranbacteria bacterium GW2011_GWD1_37_17]KKQ30895.1 MAG: Adenylyl-sulfate kinase [Candidatus Moranbacteria bacterium GW2011_GWE1_37_24]KKQ46965.1 MAG: Adenylyl-sulfate kina